MMWSIKVIGLVALTVSALCNAGELAREEINIRADAEQDPFESLTIDAAADGPESELYGGCLTAARTLIGKIYSVEVPDTGDEYVRHVPDSYELKTLPEWTSLTMVPPVSSIFDCATAASIGGYPMFKYNDGTSCTGSNRTYDSKYTSACETEEREAVFVSSASSSCPLPAVKHDIDIMSGNFTCISFTTNLMILSEAIDWCTNRKAIIFEETPKTLYSEIVQVLNGLNVGTSDFFTGAQNNTDGTWNWTMTSNPNPIDASLFVGQNTIESIPVMYMKGSDGFKFGVGEAGTFKAGTVCLAENTTP